MSDDLTIMTPFWVAREQQQPGVQSTSAWLEAADLLGAEPSRAYAVLGQPFADQPLTEGTSESLQEVLWVAASQLPAREALYRLIGLVEQRPEDTYNALAQLAVSDPRAARWLVFYWLQWCRWSDVQRLFAPDRLSRLAEILQQSRRALHGEDVAGDGDGGDG